MVLHYIYHTLEGVLILLYVPSNLFKVHTMLLKKWVRHRVFSNFLGWLMAWPKFTIGVYTEVPEIFIESFSNLHIYVLPP